MRVVIMKDSHLHFYMVSWLYETAKPVPFLKKQTFVYGSIHSATRTFSIRLSKGERGGKEIYISLFHRLNHCIPRVQSTPSYPSTRGL